MFSELILHGAVLYWFIAPVPAFRSLTVLTASGPVLGRLNKYKCMEYISFQGIPYAENPTGPLRFMPPVPRTPWTKVLDATRQGSVCVQPERRYSKHVMSEDCLNVNVYVPAMGEERLHPVAVVIHGGGLQYLSGNSDFIYGPQLLLQRDIIVVTMNYRLGPLGFLSLDIEEASGNAALKDVLLSLTWVNRNIQKFGGNPRNVTVIGHSSGAVIAHNLMLTNKSEGLFQQVVLLSGSALSPRAFSKHPKHVALALARELGIKTNNVYKLLKYLQQIDAHELLNAYAKLINSNYSILRKFAAFLPSQEIESSHAVLTVDPVQHFRKNGKLAINVTVMAGIAAQEGLNMAPTVLSSPSEVEKLRDYPEKCIPSNIEYPLNSERSKELGRAISELYFARKNDPVTAVLEIVSDTQYIYGIHYWIKQFKKVEGRNSLYYYIFDFVGDLNWCKVGDHIFLPGTAHSDEIGYIFITETTKNKIATADARSLRMMNTTMTLLSNFIHYGHPTPIDYTGLRWPDYGKDQTYLLISDELSVDTFGSHELNRRMQFWEDTYNDYFTYIEAGGKVEYNIYP